MTENIDAKRLLLDREERARFQTELLGRHCYTLIAVKSNYPGPWKHNPHTTAVVALMAQKIREIFGTAICHEAETNTAEGYIVYFLVDQDGLLVKEKMIALEEHHPLGRLADIDVLDRFKFYHRAVPRKCFLCDDKANICRRTRRHSMEEIKSFFETSLEQYCMQSLDRMILFALLAEVCCEPKFGLVTPFTNGIHSDMDFPLFVRSSIAIAPKIANTISQIDVQACQAGIISAGALFRWLRKQGKDIEQTMFDVTGGVNTHKGAIFLLLCLLTGVKLGKTWELIPEEITKLGKQVKTDFLYLASKPKELLTHGEQMYLSYGLRGVRGLVIDGTKSLFDTYLPFFRSCWGDLNERMVQTLLYIMESCEDTTVVHRAGIGNYRWMQNRAIEVRKNKSLRDTFEKECRNRLISAGGCADVLAAVVLLDMILRSMEGGSGNENQ